MFTGIIERTGKVKGVRTVGRLTEVTVGKPTSWKLKKGQSVNIDGVCSTIVRSTSGSFAVEYMPETLRVTAAAALEKGSVVNLERSLKYGDRMDGHIVQGHIEGAARLGEVLKEGKSHVLTFRLPAGLARYVVARGSIAINGVSLTVSRRHGPWVSVALVPHTLSHTNLGKLSVGDVVNVETDVMSRHTLLTKKRATVRPDATKSLRKVR